MQSLLITHIHLSVRLWTDIGYPVTGHKADDQFTKAGPENVLINDVFIYL